jgi:hypothetical protein
VNFQGPPSQGGGGRYNQGGQYHQGQRAYNITTTIEVVDEDTNTRTKLHHRITFKTNRILQTNLSCTIQAIFPVRPVERKVTIEMALGINSSNSLMAQTLIFKIITLLIDLPVVR